MAQPGSDNGTPLLEHDVALYEIAVGEDDTFRTENLSPTDWERRNVIERTQGEIHTRVALMEVTHGTYSEDGDEEATLMVFRFRFDPQKNSRRIKRVRVNIEFFSAVDNGTSPVVDAIAPEERWSVVPTTDRLSIKASAELKISSPGLSGLGLGAGARLERTVSRDISDATTITGSINLGTNKNSGESTAVMWNLRENSRRETGVPDSVEAAVLLRREDGEPFNAHVTLEAEVDFVSRLTRWFAKVPLDDPILFNPRATSSKSSKGRASGAVGLGSTDLYQFCKVRMGVHAPFTIPGSK